MYLTAYFLHPKNYHIPITSEQQLEMHKLFKQHTPNYKAALKQFFDFQARSSSFRQARGL
jgi:hypothetical protein